MTYLSNILNIIRTVYSIPVVSKVIDILVLEFLRGRALDTSNKVDDKLVVVTEAALKNKNYRAVMNNRSSKKTNAKTKA